MAILVAAMMLTLTGSGAQPSRAHNVVENRSPAPDSVVTSSPVTISIGTDDVLLDLGGAGRGFAIVVRDEAGLYYGDGCVSVLEHTMETTVALGEGGTYRVGYQFVSRDGHSLSEEYSFRFEPEPDHTPATGVLRAPECGIEPETPESAETIVPPPQHERSTGENYDEEQPAEQNLWLIAAGSALALVAIIALGVGSLRHRRAKS